MKGTRKNNWFFQGKSCKKIYSEAQICKNDTDIISGNKY